MKTLIFVLIAFFSIKIGDCQNPRPETDSGLFFKHNCETISAFNRIHKNDTTYIFGNNVNIRNDSSLNGKTIENLMLGEAVQVLDWSFYYAYEVNGHRDRWYKIKTQKGNIGYVFGALLTKNYLHYDLNKNGIKELILLGSDYLNSPHGKIKIIENNILINAKKIDSLCLDANCETLSILRIIKDPNLSNVEVIEMGTGSNHCVTTWRSNYLFLDKGNLKEIFAKSTRFYKGDPYLEIIFPSDKGGTENQIKVNKCTSRSWEEPPFLECNINEIYSFKNGEFEKIK